MTYDPFWGTSTPIDSNQFFVSSPYSDAGFEPAGGGYFTGADTLDDSYWMPTPVESNWWDDLASGVGDAVSGLDLGDLGKLGLGALGAWGSYQDYQTKRDLAKAQVAGDQANRELASGDDFAKMHALAQIIQARQGINLDPSLAYAQAVRNKMGLSPEGATPFAGVDVGGPMQVGISSADRLDEINRATNVNFAEGGGVWGGGLARLLASRSPQLLAARQAQEQRQQEPTGQRMGMSGLLARSPQFQLKQLAQTQQPQRYSGLPSFITRNPQFMAAMQQRNVLPQMGMAAGGDVQGWLAGDSPGQADDVNASLSHGEYVFDADTVAALGDGNTEAGARELDRMREAIRRHKRSAPASKIPPPSRGALGYLKGAK